MANASVTRLRLASHVALTTAEGPGRRFAVWVQGCTLACPGCCNPALFAARGGTSVEVDSLLEQLREAHHRHGLEGLTVLGGEPLQQLEGVTALCRGAVELGLGVLLFSGYRLDEARQRPGFDRLWPLVDTVVDGRFDGTRPEPDAAQGGRRFIGSRNQTLHHRTERYRDPSLWTGSPRIELRLDEDGGLSGHGQPQALEELLRALKIVSVGSDPRSLPNPWDPPL